MTEIVAFDARGKIVFRSVEPRLMTQAEIDKELKAWRVSATDRVMVTYDSKHLWNSSK
jgi:hypothetical protein